MSQRSLRPAGEAHATKLPLDRLLGEAIDRGAGMIHIEPDAQGAAVRVRADLTLARYQSISREDYFTLWQNIADRFGSEPREPFFEGSFPYNHDGGSWLIRVSMVPTPHGDSVALKINHRGTKVLPLEKLGLADHDLGRLRALLARTSGMVLFAGPSGSGGTTTLLSALASLADGSRKIISLEDPIEVHLEGVQQIQVKVVREYPERSVTFARALRAASMQDPDVIGIGQLRDPETADTALQAALSGALVLSRLHAPDAARAIARLQSLRAEPHRMADCLRAVLAQRLLRRNCAECARPEDLPTSRAPLSPADAAELAGRALAGAGCGKCHGSGVHGVVPVFELMMVDGEVARLVAEGGPVAELSARAAREGLERMAAVARRLVLAGQVPAGEYAKLL